MTNEEAIKIIKSECYTANLLNLDRTRMVNTALDLAIKALEQQSRDCKTCKHSDNGNCAGTEECHECMWESKYEQQPCEDCISRDAVLNLFSKSDEYRWETTWIRRKIEKLPSVTPKYTDEEIDKAQLVEQAYVDKMVELAVDELKTPKAEWTPVSERLPEPGVYLVSMNRLGYPQREVDGFVCGRWERFGNDVIAWCEIPEPYKAESEG